MEVKFKNPAQTSKVRNKQYSIYFSFNFFLLGHYVFIENFEQFIKIYK